MKKNSLVILLVAALLAVVVIEEMRIQELRAELASIEEAPAAETVKAVAATRNQSNLGERSRERTLAERSEEPEEEEKTTAMEDLGQAMRKMAENPAAQEMFKSGQIVAARMMYGPFLKKLNLSEEEEEYFLGVLAGEFADQQQMGMQMMGMMGEENADERQALIAKLEANKERREQEIAEFLNNEEDTQEFLKYQKRAPERQQIAGIKAAIANTGTPLTEAKETELVDLMYKVRTSSNESEKWEGANAMEMFARSDVEEIFERDWAAGQEALKSEIPTVLNEEQAAAFFESQAQTKQMHLAGIKMMKSMTKTDDE